MQKYCLVHSSSDPFVGPTVGGRRLSMARLGQQIVDEPIPLAGPPKPCRRRHFAEAERRLQDLSQSPQNRRGVRSIPAPYGTNPSPLESAEDARDRLRLKPPRAVEPMQRESAAVEARRVRKAVDGIARWQQVGYDLVNPSGERYRDAANQRPPSDEKTAIHRFKMECFGGGAGASMGLLRQIFKRFDANGDGSLSRDELRLALEAGTGRDALRGLLGRAGPGPRRPRDAAGIGAGHRRRPRGLRAPRRGHVGYDIVVPSALVDAPAAPPSRRSEPGGSAVERLRKAINVACHGAGAGASLGLLRSIFRRFDASGDGVIQRDELRKGLSIAGVDFSQGAYDEVMAEMDIDHDGAVSLPEFAHAICGAWTLATASADYREQRRPPKSLDAGTTSAVPVDLLAAELGRKALVDVTAADLAALAPGGTLAMDALYAALFGDGEVGHRATPEPSPYW
ncbi:Ca2-binding protein [Aureococcus anophagefferens]|nr:Ca2-binding protein [Aureococcus anophagefferens]